VLTSPASLELAQPGAGDGAKSHSNLAAGADVFADWRADHEAFHPGVEGVDHNNIKGYMAVHYVKEITERMGTFDRVAFVDELHCATITTDDEPGVLLDVTFDGNGDMDRESFILQVIDGVGEVTAIAPPLGNLSERGC
jgi:branched-chain amino acid transport system substrate-binding protein